MLSQDLVFFPPFFSPSAGPGAEDVLVVHDVVVGVFELVVRVHHDDVPALMMNEIYSDVQINLVKASKVATQDHAT